ncbi:MAG: hydrogenase formation protein HypD [Spirochaetes bacterium GWF1_41_5]|nr:MAG: hydrogenase formation protein HypD [Spirochaetes bacterium GWF1_41_5]
MKAEFNFRNKEHTRAIAAAVRNENKSRKCFMEVCGGHTMALRRFGIPEMLPDIKLLSGPGCPVCVTDQSYINRVIAWSKNQKNIIAVYGDLMRVPGSSSTLEKEKAQGAAVITVYSVREALKTAKENPQKNIIFSAIGFETTAPATAAAVLESEKLGLENFFVFSGHKLMPPAMAAVLEEGIPLHGYICPGHVSTITGSHIFDFIPQKYRIGCVVSGFEPNDLLLSILMLVRQCEAGKPAVEIEYARAVTAGGNEKAQQMLAEVFSPCDAAWRGVGIIKDSGLELAEKYCRFSAALALPVEFDQAKENPACLCGEILKGKKSPPDCPLFRKICCPENPVGACMVSPEGACRSWYLY